MINLDSDKIVKVPLRIDEGGAIRVGATRVSLLSVLMAFQSGSTAEQILHSFPSLDLTDIYAVISYYLANRDDLTRGLPRSIWRLNAFVRKQNCVSTRRAFANAL